MTRQAFVQTIPGAFYHHCCIGAAINLFLCGVENHTYQHYGNLPFTFGYKVSPGGRGLFIRCRTLSAVARSRTHS
jgi:hypothetical protein